MNQNQATQMIQATNLPSKNFAGLSRIQTLINYHSYILIVYSYLVIVKKIFYGTPFELIAMLLSYASCIVVLFHMCFQKHSIEVLFLTYTLDVSHIIKIFLNFYKPFRNHLDEIIHDRVEIRKRYMAFSRFFVDLLAIIPFELFSLISTNNRLFFLSVLRLNRCFRYVSRYALHLIVTNVIHNLQISV